MEKVTDQDLINRLNQSTNFNTPVNQEEEKQEEAPSGAPGFFEGISSAPSHAKEAMESSASMVGELISSLANDSDTSRYHRMKAWKNIEEMKKLEKDMGTAAHVVSGGIQSLPAIAGYAAAGPVGAALVGGIQEAGDIKTTAQREGIDVKDSEVIAAATGAGLVDATIGRFLPAGATPFKRVLSDAIGGAASGGQHQIFQNLALGKDWNENAGVAAAGGGVMGGGISGLNAALNASVNSKGKKSISDVREVTDYDNNVTPSEDLQNDIFEHANASGRFEEIMKNAKTTEEVNQAIDAKLGSDAEYGYTTAFIKSQNIANKYKIPLTDAAYDFDLESITKKNNKGRANQSVGIDDKKMAAAKKANEQDKVRGLGIAKAQKKGWTPESHRRDIKKRGEEAFESIRGVFTTNSAKVHDMYESLKRDTSASPDTLNAYKDLDADLKNLKKIMDSISQRGEHSGEDAIRTAKRAYKRAAELGLLGELKNVDGDTFDPLVDIQTGEFLEKALVSEYPSFHQGSPDVAKETKQPFKMGILDWGLAATSFPALVAKKATGGVMDVVSGASRKRGFKKRISEGEDRMASISELSKTPRKPTSPEAPEAPDSTPPPAGPTPPEGPINPQNADFEDAVVSGDLEGMAAASEKDLKDSGYTVTPRTSSKIPPTSSKPQDPFVAKEEVVEEVKAATPERTGSLTPDPIKKESVVEDVTEVEPEPVPDVQAVPVDTTEAPGYIRGAKMDAMKPKELRREAEKLESDIDKSKDELIEKQNEGLVISSQDLAKIQKHFERLKENSAEAKKVADFKEQLEREEKEAAEKKKQEEKVQKLQEQLAASKAKTSAMSSSPKSPEKKEAPSKEESSTKKEESKKPASYQRSDKKMDSKKATIPTKEESVVEKAPEESKPSSYERGEEKISAGKAPIPKKEEVVEEVKEVVEEVKEEAPVLPKTFQRPEGRISYVKRKENKVEEPKESEPYVEDGEVVSEKEFVKTSAAVPPVTKVWTDTIEEVEKIPLASREPEQVIKYRKAKANMQKIDETLNSIAEETPEDREILEALMHSKELSIEDPNFKKKLKNAAKEYRTAQATQGSNAVKSILTKISENVKKRVGADLYAIEDSLKKFADKYKKDADKPKSSGSKKDPKPDLTEEEVKSLVKESTDAVDEFVAAYDIPEAIVKEAYMSEGIIKGKDMFDPVKLNKVIARLNTAKKKEDAKKALQDAASKKKEDLSAEKADKESEILQKKRDIRDAQIELSNLKTALASKKVSAENKTKISDKIISLENDLKKMNDELGNLNYGLELVEKRNKKLISDYEESVKAAEGARLEAEAAKKAEENLDIVMSQAEDIKKRMVDKGFPSVMADDFIERQFAYKKTPLTDKEMNAIFQKAMNEVKKEHEEFLKLRQEFLKKKEEATQSSKERQTVAQEETRDAIEDADPEVIKGLSEEVLKQIHTAFNQSKEEYDTLKAMLDTIDNMKAEVKEKIGNKETKTLSAFKKAMEEVETLSKQYPDDRRMWLTEGTYQKLLNTITGDDLDKTWYGRAAISLRAAAYGIYGPTPSHGVLSLDTIKRLAKEKGLPAPKLKSEVDPMEAMVEEVSEILTKGGQTVKVKKRRSPSKPTDDDKPPTPPSGGGKKPTKNPASKPETTTPTQTAFDFGESAPEPSPQKPASKKATPKKEVAKAGKATLTGLGPEAYGVKPYEWTPPAGQKRSNELKKKYPDVSKIKDIDIVLDKLHTVQSFAVRNDLLGKADVADRKSMLATMAERHDLIEALKKEKKRRGEPNPMYVRPNVTVGPLTGRDYTKKPNADAPKGASASKQKTSSISEAIPTSNVTSTPSSKMRMGKLMGEVIPTQSVSRPSVVPTPQRAAEEMNKRKKTYSKSDLDMKGKEAFFDLDTSGNIDDAVRYLEDKALRHRADFPEESPVTALVDMIDLDKPDYFSTSRMDALQSMGDRSLQKIAGYTRSDYKKKALDTLRENIRVHLDFVKKLKEALPELRKAAEEGSPNSRKRVKAVAEYLKAVAQVNRLDAYDKLGKELIAHAESLATPARTASKAKSNPKPANPSSSGRDTQVVPKEALKSIEVALNWVENNSKNPSYKEIAKKLQSFDFSDIPIRGTPKSNSAEAALVIDRHPDGMTEKRIGLRDNPRVEAVLHEVIHAATYEKIRNPHTKAEKQAVAELGRIYDYLKKQAKTNTRLDARDKGRLDLWLTGIPKETSVLELVTHGYTNQAIQEILKKIPSQHENGSVWSDFVASIKKLLNLSERTALDDVLEANAVFFEKGEGRKAPTGGALSDSVPKGALSKEEMDDRVAKLRASRIAEREADKSGKYPPVIQRLNNQEALDRFDELIEAGETRANAIKRVIHRFKE